MNALDWILALLLAYSVVRAAMQGFFRVVFSLFGLILGFALACWRYAALSGKLAGVISSPPVAQFCAFLLILIGCMVAANLLGRVLRSTASAVGLGFLDRLAGAAFGLLRGGLLGAGLLLAITAFLPAANASGLPLALSSTLPLSLWMKTSLCAPYFLRAIHAVSFVMPSDLQRRLLDGLEQFRHTAPAWTRQTGR